MKKLLIVGVIALMTSSNAMAKESCNTLLQELSYIEEGDSGRSVEEVCEKIKIEMKKDKKCHKSAYEWFGENLDTYCFSEVK